MAKTPRQKLIDANDDLARSINRIIHQNKCCQCNKSGEYYKLDWSHVYSRAAHSIRWDEDNAMLHCFTHHHDWHANPLKSAAWFDQMYPGRKQRLNEKLSTSTSTISITQLREINQKLKERLATLQWK